MYGKLYRIEGDDNAKEPSKLNYLPMFLLVDF
uniref:Dna-directed rna polymerases and iii subunit rpabc3 n=1 Tax=Triatoma infestans TaxID=30076 RepID=A0A161M7D8_TRIIF